LRETERLIRSETALPSFERERVGGGTARSQRPAKWFPLPNMKCLK
jgi:hypothetical protein